MNRDALIRRLTVHEGLKLKPYRDTVGKLTIGIGRNLDDVGISQDEAVILCGNDVLKAEKALDALCGWWRDLDDIRQQVLCEMVFNLGMNGVGKFTRMLGALQRKDFGAAADEMIDSRWASQVGQRAHTLAHAMRHGAFAKEIG